MKSSDLETLTNVGTQRHEQRTCEGPPDKGGILSSNPKPVFNLCLVENFLKIQV